MENLLLSAYRRRTGRDPELRLEAIPLPARTPLFGEERPRYVHLITSGVASIVTHMKNGSAVEVGMSGYESFPECTYLLGPQVPKKYGVMQVGGTGLRTGFREFREEFDRDAVLRDLVLRAVQYESFALAELAACNGLHQVEERLARWLLMVEDRMGEPDLAVTQDYLAQVLGSTRSTVTLAAGSLQRSGLIDYRRGHVKIERRDRLEEVACECYGVIRGYFRAIYD